MHVHRFVHWPVRSYLHIAKVKRGNSGHGIIPVSLYKSHHQLYTIDSLGVPLMLQ